eukprot:COSAG05_NODE_947_length_6480_cov_15.036671_6_plen_72_part_00
MLGAGMLSRILREMEDCAAVAGAKLDGAGSSDDGMPADEPQHYPPPAIRLYPLTRCESYSLPREAKHCGSP